MADDPKGKVCPCCGDRFSDRQIRRHRHLFLGRIAQDLDAQSEDDDLNPDPGDAGTAPGAANEVELALENAGGDLGGDDVGDAMGMEVDDVGAEPLAGAVDMNIDEDVLHALLPELPPAQGLRRNPPVTIQDWPDPDDDFAASDIENDDTLIDGVNRDREYVERDEPLGFDPDDEPGMGDKDVQALLQDYLGDLADEEWIDMYERDLSDKDFTTLEFLASRLRTHFSRQTYNDLRHGPCKSLDLPSEFVAWRRLRILSGLETRAYDCCINVCCCFLGKYEALDSCPFCKERRYNSTGKPRRVFRYTPLIPQLHALFQNADMVKELRYRAEAEATYKAGMVRDVFDGEHYRKLRVTPVHEGSDYRFFDNPEDIALGLSTDGFTLFKRRRRGLSTGWPIILIIHNLHPRIRTRLQNVLCVGVIGGPKQCKDLNSYLVPLADEFVMLAEGIESSKVAVEEDKEDGDEAARDDDDIYLAGFYFVLHAFIIIVFGDIPAISKLLAMKGHNALLPCRACYIRGVLCRLAQSSVYYVPLTAPGDTEPFPFNLIQMRTHASFFTHYAELEAAKTKTARADLAQRYGINSRPVFAHLASFDLACSAPYDLMHLLFENLVPNMIQHWTGDFKGLNQGTGNYQLSKAQWAEIGQISAKATRTTPAAFVGTLPNIEQDGNLYKAEAYSFWFQYVTPIVLKDRLPDRYYQHFLLMREIFLWCLEYEITNEQIDKLEDMIVRWVHDYEKLYYQYKQARLPTCPLTIHTLLHIPYYIRQTGPLWASWAFVMERFCGHLLPAVKNRVRPYEMLDNYVQRRAQMQIVSRVYNLPSLAKPRINYRYQAGERLSSREWMYPGFETVVLGTPIRRKVQMTEQLANQLTKYFGVVYVGFRGRELRARIDPDSLVRYGRFRLTGDGDKIRVADLIARDPIARDNSFVRYELLPDANAAHRNQPDVPVRVTYYGQVQDIYYVEFIKDLENDIREPYLLVRVKECNTGGVDAALPNTPVVKYNRLSTPDIIHIDTINAVVGRVQLTHNTWAIVDRSRNGAHTQFIDEEGNDLD